MNPESFSMLMSPTTNLLLVMVIIWTSGVLFRKLHQPPVLGELLAGIIFGPPLLGIIHPDPTLSVLSELGVFFLMFYAGLETNHFDLKNATGAATVIGTLGFLVPLVLGYFAGKHLFHTTDVQSLFLGLGLSITSIAVNARVLNDLHLQPYRVMPVILGASLVDDVLAMAFLSVLIGLSSTGTVDVPHTLLILLKVGAFFGATALIGLKFFPCCSHHFVTREGKGFTFALIIALLFGILAELAQLHVVLGAYMAGLFISEGLVSQELFQKVKDRFVAITYGFLGPVFFVSLAFHMNFEIFNTHFRHIILFLLIAITGKIIGAGGSAYAMRMSFNEALIVGFSMNGRGAVELVIAAIGIKLGLIDDTLFSILIVVAFITTLMVPLTLGLLLQRIKMRGLQLLDTRSS